METDRESAVDLKTGVANTLKLIFCLLALCGLTTLRFQKVTIYDSTRQRTNTYWVVQLPGKHHKVQIPEKGHYTTAEYNIRGLYGLLNVERRSLFVLTNARRPLPLSDPSIEAAERINLLQKQGPVWRKGSPP